MTTPAPQKDFWDRLQIVLSPVGGLLTAVAVASLGIFVLESSGRRHDWTVLISDTLAAGTGSEQLDDVEADLDGIK